MWVEILMVVGLNGIMIFFQDLLRLLNLLQLLGSNEIAWSAPPHWPNYAVQLMIEHAGK